MTLEELRETAFAKWLNAQTEDEAAFHVFDCLQGPHADSLAWALFEAVHGTGWEMSARLVPHACTHAVKVLRGDEQALEFQKKYMGERDGETVS